MAVFDDRSCIGICLYLYEHYGALGKRYSKNYQTLQGIGLKKPELLEIAECLGVSSETIRYCIKIMEKAGEIERKGATKKGEWIVTEKSSEG